ncbi:MAG: response regulator [Tranquillimonas sp.]
MDDIQIEMPDGPKTTVPAPAPPAEARTTQPAAPERPEVLRVLLAEDDNAAAMMLTGQLNRQGHRVERAANGAEAYGLLREDPARADIVITDRIMPVMDGVALIRRLRRETATASLPTILLTGDEDTGDAVAAGAFYHLVKPVPQDMLRRVLAAAGQEIGRRRRQQEALRRHQSAFADLQQVRFTLNRLDQVDAVASFLGSLSPRPERSVVGLTELLRNGIEHGLMRLGLAAKQRHLAEGTLETELARRADAVTGEVEATGLRRNGTIVYVIRDSGPGFRWQPFINSDPSRSQAASGRGIARAAVTFDRLSYDAPGKAAVAVVSSHDRHIW